MASKGLTELGSFERCRNCGAELAARTERCPGCGTVTVSTDSRDDTGKGKSFALKLCRGIIAVLLLIVGNLYFPYVKPYLRAMWPPWYAPLVDEAMARTVDHTDAVKLLGSSIH